MNELFRKLSTAVAQWVGTPGAFMAALGIVVMWLLTGPLFHYSDTWQLVINTGTTIITFLMVFLIQNTQNRDSRAIHLKLDELVRVIKGARNAFVSAEDLSDEELEILHDEFSRLHEHYDKQITLRKQRRSTKA